MSKNDTVNHPPHYTTGSIEVIEYIEDKLTLDQLEGYFVGNVIKYVSRYKHKGGVEDLKKAAWYLGRMIVKLENTKQPDMVERNCVTCKHKKRVQFLEPCYSCCDSEKLPHWQPGEDK